MTQVIYIQLTDRQAVIIMTALHLVAENNDLADCDIKQARGMHATLFQMLNQSHKGINQIVQSAAEAIEKKKRNGGGG